MSRYTSAMASQKYTLQSLASHTGIESRTIRGYIQQGLLRGAATLGRGAFYTSDHLNRLYALKYWKETHGRSLEDIRRLLISTTDQEIETIANQFRQPHTQGPAPLTLGSKSASSASDYLRSLRESKSTEVGKPQTANLVAPAVIANARKQFVENESAQASLADSPIDRLLLALGGKSGTRSVPRKAKGDPWIKVPVTADIELHVRGVDSPDQLARLERIADHIRDILLGGSDHE